MREQTQAHAEAMRSFEHAERVHLVEAGGGEVAFVVLAVVDVDGRDFAMVVREEDLGPTLDATHNIYLFGYQTDGIGAPALATIDDDDLYTEVLHVCAELLEYGDEDDAA